MDIKNLNSKQLNELKRDIENIFNKHKKELELSMKEKSIPLLEKSWNFFEATEFFDLLLNDKNNEIDIGNENDRAYLKKILFYIDCYKSKDRNKANGHYNTLIQASRYSLRNIHTTSQLPHKSIKEIKAILDDKEIKLFFIDIISISSGEYLHNLFSPAVVKFLSHKFFINNDKILQYHKAIDSSISSIHLKEYIEEFKENFKNFTHEQKNKIVEALWIKQEPVLLKSFLSSISEPLDNFSPLYRNDSKFQNSNDKFWSTITQAVLDKNYASQVVSGSEDFIEYVLLNHSLSQEALKQIICQVIEEKNPNSLLKAQKVADVLSENESLLNRSIEIINNLSEKEKNENTQIMGSLLEKAKLKHELSINLQSKGNKSKFKV